MGKFTEYLQTMARYSERIDEGTITGKEFTDYQMMSISKARDAGEIDQGEYLALNVVYHALEPRFRAALGLYSPTPWEMYTREKWHSDGQFKPLPGQPIERSIYEEMQPGGAAKLSPAALSVCYQHYGIRLSSGFISEGRMFGRADTKYYYLGRVKA